MPAASTTRAPAPSWSRAADVLALSLRPTKGPVAPEFLRTAILDAPARIVSFSTRHRVGRTVRLGGVAETLTTHSPMRRPPRPGEPAEAVVAEWDRAPSSPSTRGMRMPGEQPADSPWDRHPLAPSRPSRSLPAPARASRRRPARPPTAQQRLRRPCATRTLTERCAASPPWKSAGEHAHRDTSARLRVRATSRRHYDLAARPSREPARDGRRCPRSGPAGVRRSPPDGGGLRRRADEAPARDTPGRPCHTAGPARAARLRRPATPGGIEQLGTVLPRVRPDHRPTWRALRLARAWPSTSPPASRRTLRRGRDAAPRSRAADA